MRIDTQIQPSAENRLVKSPEYLFILGILYGTLLLLLVRFFLLHSLTVNEEMALEKADAQLIQQRAGLKKLAQEARLPATEIEAMKAGVLFLNAEKRRLHFSLSRLLLGLEHGLASSPVRIEALALTWKDASHRLECRGVGPDIEALLEFKKQLGGLTTAGEVDFSTYERTERPGLHFTMAFEVRE